MAVHNGGEHRANACRQAQATANRFWPLSPDRWGWGEDEKMHRMAKKCAFQTLGLSSYAWQTLVSSMLSFLCRYCHLLCSTLRDIALKSEMDNHKNDASWERRPLEVIQVSNECCSADSYWGSFDNGDIGWRNVLSASFTYCTCYTLIAKSQPRVEKHKLFCHNLFFSSRCKNKFYRRCSPLLNNENCRSSKKVLCEMLVSEYSFI